MPDSAAPQPQHVATPAALTLVRPTEGLQLAYDPRVPRDVQAFEFVAGGLAPGHRVQWVLNGKPLSNTANGRLLWQVQRGSYTLLAQDLGETGEVRAAKTVHFNVK